MYPRVRLTLVYAKWRSHHIFVVILPMSQGQLQQLLKESCCLSGGIMNILVF